MSRLYLVILALSWWSLVVPSLLSVVFWCRGGQLLVFCPGGLLVLVAVLDMGGRMA